MNQQPFLNWKIKIIAYHSPPHQRTQIRSLRLHSVCICESWSRVSCILLVEPWVYLQISSQWRPVLLFWCFTWPHITPKTASERRNIVSISSSLWGPWRFLRVHVWIYFWWCSVTSWVLHVSLVVIWAHHVSAAFAHQKFNLLKKFIESDSVGLVDFKHGDEDLSELFSEVFLDHGDFFQERVEINVEIFIIINFIKLFLENHFNDHEAQGKNVGFFEVNFGVFVALWKGCDQLRGKVHSIKIIFIQDLVIRPVGLLLSDNTPSCVVANSAIPNADMAAFNGHFRNALDNGKQLIVILRADIFEKDKVGEQQVIGPDEVMQGRSMGRYGSVLGLAEEELHVLETDVLDRAVNGADWIIAKGTGLGNGLTLRQPVFYVVDF